MVVFPRHDKDGKGDRVVFELIGYRIPLREICRNRFLFWLIIWYSTRVTDKNPVLNFGTWQKVLTPVRGRVSQCWASMVLKRAGGLPFRQFPCQLSLVRDKSEDSENSVLRIMLIRDSDISMFDEYLDNPPGNPDNFEFVTKIVTAYKNGTGTFTNTRVTVG